MFETYKEVDEDRIGPEGIMKLCEHMAIEPTDVRLLVLAWQLRAQEQGYFSRVFLLINKSYVHTLLQYQEGREAAGALALSPLSFALSPLSSPSLLSLSLIPLPLSFPSPPPARVEERTQNAARCNASCLHPRSCVLSCNRLASAVAATGA